MGWFKRLKDGIQTATRNKKEAPDGVWYKCPNCKNALTSKEHKENLYVCTSCDYHDRIGSAEYFSILFDGKWNELFGDLVSIDFLEFEDMKSYRDRLQSARNKTGLEDAITVAQGKVNRQDLVVDDRHRIIGILFVQRSKTHLVLFKLDRSAANSHR